MNYQESFCKLLNQQGLKALDDVFLLRSYLSDYIGNSIHDLELLDAYCSLNHNEVLLHVVNNLQLKESKNQIKTHILKADKKYSALQYIKSMEPLLLYLYPHEYQPIDESKIKKQSSAIKVVRATKERKEAASPLSIQKHISPPLPKGLTIAVKPKAPKAVHSNVAYSKVRINCICRKLIISYSEDDIARVFDSVGNDYSNNINTSLCVDKISINIEAKQRSLYVMLPKKQYDYIDITHVGKELTLMSDYKGELKAKKVDIISIGGLVSTNMEICDLCINKEGGRVFVNGKISNLLINSNKCDIGVYVDSLTQEKIEINNNNGNVNVHNIGVSVNHPIKYALKKSNIISGIYQLGSKKILLNICNQKGKICVR